MNSELSVDAKKPKSFRSSEISIAMITSGKLNTCRTKGAGAIEVVLDDTKSKRHAQYMQYPYEASKFIDIDSE